MSDTGFDAKAALKLGEKKLAPKLGDYTLAELRQLEAAERGEGGSARSGVLRLLQAEIAARADAEAAQLSPASIEQMHAVAYAIAGAPESVEELTKETVFDRAIVALTPIFNRVEALSAELDALNAPPATTEVPAGSVAEVKAGSVKASTLLKDVAALAVCPAGDEDGPVNAYFTVPVSAEDFEISETFRKAKYLHAIKLTHDMEPMAAAQVVALDSAGRPLARVAWGVPLYAGGGRNGEFSAGYIAFDV
jgi:hypothetical protein